MATYTILSLDPQARRISVVFDDGVGRQYINNLVDPGTSTTVEVPQPDGQVIEQAVLVPLDFTNAAAVDAYLREYWQDNYAMPPLQPVAAVTLNKPQTI